MSTRTSSDLLTNLSHLLPTGTFLVFQALAPIFTNNGSCGVDEKVVTGILLFFFFLLCFVLSFVDSITTEAGKVYYGVVTTKGLYNHQFKKIKISKDLKQGDDYFTGGDENDDYKVHFSDFVNGTLNVITFGALSCLTPPISTCYYPGLSPTVVKTGPILAALVVGVLFALFPSGRHGVGFALTTSGFGFVPESTPPGQTTAANGNGSTDKLLSPDSNDSTVLDIRATTQQVTSKVLDIHATDEKATNKVE